MTDGPGSWRCAVYPVRAPSRASGPGWPYSRRSTRSLLLRAAHLGTGAATILSERTKFCDVKVVPPHLYCDLHRYDSDGLHCASAAKALRAVLGAADAAVDETDVLLALHNGHCWSPSGRWLLQLPSPSDGHVRKASQAMSWLGNHRMMYPVR